MLTSALNDLLDDLSPKELTSLVHHLWLSKHPATRANIKAFRKSIGKVN